jgi:hypothetical protein
MATPKKTKEVKAPMGYKEKKAPKAKPSTAGKKRKASKSIY